MRFTRKDYQKISHNGRNIMRRLWTSPFWVAIVAAVLIIAAFALFVFRSESNAGRFVAFAAFCFALVAALRIRAIERQTELETAQRADQLEVLIRQNDEYKQTVDALSDGLDVALFVCDARGIVEYANRRGLEFFRASAVRDKSIVSISLNDDLEKLVITAAGQREPTTDELQFRHPVDRIGQVKAWRSPAGKVFVSIYEITALRRLMRVRQDFVANVSHELRTPMTIIRGMAENLLDEEDAATKERNLNKIMVEVDRLSSITQDLLILSTAESAPVRKADCNIADVIGSVVWQLSTKANNKGLLLSYDGPDALMILANPTQMTQVVMNLIDNAITYTSEGEVVVRLETHGEEICLTVSDTGSGISSEHLPRIFERFYRADKSRSRALGGTGLGLSIVKHIVEAHDGEVTVESALHRGSTFTVKLPIGNPSVR
jgi:two-component system phosphate regulon sensor histidine kinase PhoR